MSNFHQDFANKIIVFIDRQATFHFYKEEIIFIELKFQLWYYNLEKKNVAILHLN